MEVPGTVSLGSCSFSIYSDPPLNEPAATLRVDLILDPPQRIYGCNCIVSTVQKIEVTIMTSLPKISLFYRKFEQRLGARLQTRDRNNISPQLEFSLAAFSGGVLRGAGKAYNVERTPLHPAGPGKNRDQPEKTRIA